jgi:subtilisin family serine protease
VVVVAVTLGLVAVGAAPSAPGAGAATDPVAAPTADVTPAATPATAEIADTRLVVGLEPAASPVEATAIAADAGAAGAEVVDDDTIVVDAPPGGAGALQAEELRQDPRVKYVEPNYRVSSSFTPDDPQFPALSGLRNAQPGGIRAEAAWNTTLGSRDIVVGVLDSGIDTTHPDLVGNLWSNRIGVGGCAYGTHGYNTFTKECTSSDQYGHGTHVAGIIGAVGDNGVGITGVAPRVSLMSLTMLNREGDGSIAGAIAAIDWAIKAKQRGIGVRVLSASWGGVGYSQGLTDAIQRAGDAGLLFVAAAGNSHLDVEQDPIYPCAVGLPNVVCVAASGNNDRLTAFSDFGATHVDLAAPGEHVVSTVPRGVIPGCGPGLYCALDGTSMAAPMVSGAAVLALAADPALSMTALRALLVQAVAPIPQLAGKVVSGGRLDVCKVVPGCFATTPPRPPTAPSRLAVGVAHGTATLQWTVPSSNGNGTGISGYRIDGPGGTRLVGPGVRQVNVSGLVDNTNAAFSVRARNATGESVPIVKTGRSLSGGYLTDRMGRLRAVQVPGGPPPSSTSALPLPATQGTARGLALLPDGTGGYVLDGFGRLHPFGIGGNPAPPAATGVRSSAASDWARGVALMPDGTSGYVIDGSGRFFGFSIGNNRRPPKPNNTPSLGGDLARGITITASGAGGYLVEASGKIHRFGIGGAALPMVASGGPSWPGRNLARGIALSRADGGGFVLDRTGALHPFATRGHKPARPLSAPPWPGLDQARGLGL